MADILAEASRPGEHSSRSRELAREVAVLRDKADIVRVLCQLKHSQTSNSHLCRCTSVVSLSWGQPVGDICNYTDPLHC